jgi:hypothetical protein
MKILRYQVLVRILGALGVSASLVFVGFELKQSRDIAIADIFQQRTVMWRDLKMSAYSPEQYESAFNKIANENVEFSDFDILVFDNFTDARFTFYGNMHFQYQLGMITEEEWNAARLNISGEFTFPCIANWWESQKEFWRESFSSEVAMLMAKVDAPPCDIRQYLNGG